MCVLYVAQQHKQITLYGTKKIEQILYKLDFDFTFNIIRHIPQKYINIDCLNLA